MVSWVLYPKSVSSPFMCVCVCVCVSVYNVVRREVREGGGVGEHLICLYVCVCVRVCTCMEMDRERIRMLGASGELWSRCVCVRARRERVCVCTYVRG